MIFKSYTYNSRAEGNQTIIKHKINWTDYTPKANNNTTSKLVPNTITSNDHSYVPCNVLVNQNEHEKGTQFMQATGNGLNENNNHKGNDFV